MKIRTVLTLGMAIGFAGHSYAADPKPAPAAEKKDKPTYLTSDESPEDLRLQGEYGDKDAGKAKYGVQVIALGDDNYRAVIYPGGLPGAGWDGNKKNKVEIEAKRDAGNGNLGFDKDGYSLRITDGRFVVMKTAGNEAMTLNKVTRSSPTIGLAPPAGAKVLYGSPDDASKWNGGHPDKRGLLAAGCTSKDKFKDFTLHAEFFLPFKPLGRGQDRGNSGVYLQDRYECQVLDSFALKGENNECGGFYQQFAPSVNMCLPPLQWQTYDIDFTAARFDADGKKTAPAHVTVKHNGVVIQDNVELAKPTPGGGLSGKDTADAGPIQLQGHGNPVFYRNIWILEK